MEQPLLGFVRALRAAGADTSPAESIDAAQALALLGYADRADLKLAMGLLLAKSEPEKQLHDRVFDLYFPVRPQGDAPGAPRSDAPPPATSATGPHTTPTARSQAHEPDVASPPASTADLAGLPASGDQALQSLLQLAQGEGAPVGSAANTALQLALARAAQAAGVDDIRFASQLGHYTGRLLAQLPIAPLEARLREHLLADPAQRSAAEADELAALQAARAALQRAARAVVLQRFELYGQGATDQFMNEVVVRRPLGRMSPPDMARLQQVIARMARRLAVRHARRRRVRLRGQLDFRRTFRANAGHDSVPVDLVFKHRRRDKPRIVVVCDVSSSVSAHVHFLMMFLYALRGTVTDLASFAFSHRLKNVDAPLQTLPFDDAMALILKELGGGATDYGQALADLQAGWWDDIDRRTTVLVLGDGRSNHANPRLDLMAELAERACRVVWLCPEPPSRWGSGDSCMRLYQPFCTQVRHVANVADLERAVDDTLAAYA